MARKSIKFELTISNAEKEDYLKNKLQEHMNDISETIKFMKFSAVNIKTEIRQASFKEIEIDSDIEGLK